MYWLGEVVTKTEKRGQGIGSALIADIIKVATARGITQLWLYTPDKQSFYRNLGWKNHEQRTVTGELVTVMVLELCAEKP
ncbi:GNAT family N-acetyltransferase [Candidatus Pantoea multigeneris]|uniref:GNAT family N-acetyltransferase n=1 Tax=Candidatus Pantoea multigeneris TaxID=2608357 RepID=A0ABX0R7I7_9GAMM|nr:GNAT family N-acetyltransferase [Pantoea multigeneris]NIF21057.1 GNAT family N-acetyltransferase [Pantoea multigeneris]